MTRTSTWKSVERKVAEKLGGVRVGNRGTNSEDVAHDVFSVEVKHRKNLPQIVRDSMDQCRRNAPDGKVPLVVLHAANTPRYLCVLDIEDLVQLLEGTEQ